MAEIRMPIPKLRTRIPRVPRTEVGVKLAEKVSAKPAVESTPRAALKTKLEAGASTPTATVDALAKGSIHLSKETAERRAGKATNSTPLKTEASKPSDSKDDKGNKKSETADQTEMSAAEILMKKQRLLELQQQERALQEHIKTLKKQKRSPDNARHINANIANLVGVQKEMQGIQTELGVAITKASLPKKIAIIAALTAVGGGMFISQAAKDSGSGQQH